MINEPARMKAAGLALSAERRRLKLTQQQFAELLGVERAFVTRIETGHRVFSLAALSKLAAVTSQGVVDRYVAAYCGPTSGA